VNLGKSFKAATAPVRPKSFNKSLKLGNSSGLSRLLKTAPRKVGAAKVKSSPKLKPVLKKVGSSRTLAAVAATGPTMGTVAVAASGRLGAVYRDSETAIRDAGNRVESGVNEGLEKTRENIKGVAEDVGDTVGSAVGAASSSLLGKLFGGFDGKRMLLIVGLIIVAIVIIVIAFKAMVRRTPAYAVQQPQLAKAS
jgi:hypothetical protein